MSVVYIALFIVISGLFEFCVFWFSLSWSSWVGKGVHVRVALVCNSTFNFFILPDQYSFF